MLLRSKRENNEYKWAKVQNLHDFLAQIILPTLSFVLFLLQKVHAVNFIVEIQKQWNMEERLYLT